MKHLKTVAAWIVMGVAFVLWSEHCYNRGAEAAAEQCEYDAEYVPNDPKAHLDV